MREFVDFGFFLLGSRIQIYAQCCIHRRKKAKIIEYHTIYILFEWHELGYVNDWNLFYAWFKPCFTGNVLTFWYSPSGVTLGILNCSPYILLFCLWQKIVAVKMLQLHTILYSETLQVFSHEKKLCTEFVCVCALEFERQARNEVGNMTFVHVMQPWMSQCGSPKHQRRSYWKNGCRSQRYAAKWASCTFYGLRRLDVHTTYLFNGDIW